eukprot:13378719-Alexandrium_andersonii.AAC.1
MSGSHARLRGQCTAQGGEAQISRLHSRNTPCAKLRAVAEPPTAHIPLSLRARAAHRATRVDS